MDNLLSLENFQNALDCKKWSLKDLAREYDLQYSDGKGSIYNTLRKWNTGVCNPTMKRLSRVSNLLECDLDYLLGVQDTPRKEYAHIAEMTGLSYEAVENLQKLGKEGKEYKDLLPIISAIIEDTDLLQDIGSAVYAEYTDGYIQRKNKEQISVKAKTLYNAEMTSVFESFMNLVNDLHNELKGKAKKENEA